MVKITPGSERKLSQAVFQYWLSAKEKKNTKTELIHISKFNNHIKLMYCIYTHKICSSVSVTEMYPCLLILTFFDYLNFTIHLWPHIRLLCISLHKWNLSPHLKFNDYQKTDECFNINKYQYYNVCTILLHLKVSVFLYFKKKILTSTLFAYMLFVDWRKTARCKVVFEQIQFDLM